MILKSYGHATLSLENNEIPYLITDPWLIGSCYWRSWWLQHYPSEKDLSNLKKTKCVFITHEHWDHAHFPSLKKFFLNKKIFIPKLNSKRLKNALMDQFDVNEIEPLKWFKLNEIQYISIPLYNDDSILLFKYKKYLICNINDSKPTPQIIKKIYELKKKENLNIILMQSYAPASINNSFKKNNNEIVSLKSKIEYINYVMKISKKIDAKYFVPFASQAIFSRPDSKWANKFKITWPELKESWNINTKLLKSYVEFDLDQNQYDTYVNDFLKSSKMDKLSDLKYQNNISAKYNLKDLCIFSTICRPVKYILTLIYPFGINFNFNQEYFNYNFFSEKFIKLVNQPNNYIEIPINEFIESCKNFNFTDLGTSFIMKISIKSKINIIQTYLLFVFLTFSEKGYFSNFKILLKQFILILNNIFPKKLY